LEKEKEKEILKIIFEENIELFNLLIEILQHGDKYFSEKLKNILIFNFFDDLKKKNKTIEILNTFFKIISIKD